MLFAVILRDKPGQGELRSRLLPAHLEWLEYHRETVLVGGSLREERAHVPIGGLWIVEADTKQSVASLLRTDPFFEGGLRDKWEIFHWSKAFDRKVPV